MTTRARFFAASLSALALATGCSGSAGRESCRRRTAVAAVVFLTVVAAGATTGSAAENGTG
jgi:hypothetical protein